jgi:hypothetical protein
MVQEVMKDRTLVDGLPLEYKLATVEACPLDP